ncbi:MAG: serine/threonine-protein kinase [Acidobacteriota bacterium]
MASKRQRSDSKLHGKSKDIFLEAYRLEGEEREAFLKSACGGNAELRAEVDSLLDHHDGSDGDSDGWLSQLSGSQPSVTTRSSPGMPRISPGRSVVGSSADLETTLTPGTLVASRYRIVARLGGGGMGEVYRADDLILQETVALKFLKPSPNDRWLDEVRLARQVTHPNVCRVFDVSEVDGKPFISMEYVDGEDLASLLNRIGRIPRDRTVFIARQLFSGLAAAHAKGVLHRDLKPANIMIDGRGEVRITDFGIASRESEDTVGPLAGTPAYMAPEQFSGEDVTARTDLYSLGLVLYELTTGIFPFDGSGRLAFARAHLEDAPAPPSSHVVDIEPILERIILKCLEKNPADRPSSALAVAAALPGGDPLTLAVSIGETPSPEMVAEAGGRSRIETRTAAWLGGLAAILLALVMALSDASSRLDTAGLTLPPEVLAEKAREKLRAFGWTEPPVDEAWGFLENHLPLQEISAGGELTDPSAPGASSILFWYRQSPIPMEPSGLQNITYWGGHVYPYDPPLIESGMSMVLLHPRGTLDDLSVRPLKQPGLDDTPPSDEDIEALFNGALRSAGLNPDRLTAIEPDFSPRFFADQRLAYRGTSAANPGLELDVRLASYAGRLTYFRLIPASEVYDSYEAPTTFWPLSLIDNLDDWWEVLLLLSVVAAIPLMRRNVRRGRGDQRSARRLAGFFFLTTVGLWVARGPHLADITAESAMIRQAFGKALVEASMVWLFYLALEPYARRLWPHTLIAWTRLLAGRVTDPMVGRSLLYGVIFGALWTLFHQLDSLLPGWLGLSWTPPAISAGPFENALGTPKAIAGFGEQLMGSVFDAVFSLLLLLLARLLFRRPEFAILAYVALVTVLYAHNGVGSPLSWLMVGLLVACTEAVALVRFGLVTFATGVFVSGILSSFPVTLDFTSWYATTGLAAVAVAAGLAALGLAHATALYAPHRELSTERRSTHGADSRHRRS